MFSGIAKVLRWRIGFEVVEPQFFGGALVQWIFLPAKFAAKMRREHCVRAGKFAGQDLIGCMREIGFTGFHFGAGRFGRDVLDCFGVTAAIFNCLIAFVSSLDGGLDLQSDFGKSISMSRRKKHRTSSDRRNIIHLAQNGGFSNLIFIRYAIPN